MRYFFIKIVKNMLEGDSYYKTVMNQISAKMEYIEEKGKYIYLDFTILQRLHVNKILIYYTFTNNFL